MGSVSTPGEGDSPDVVAGNGSDRSALAALLDRL